MIRIVFVLALLWAGGGIPGAVLLALPALAVWCAVSLMVEVGKAKAYGGD